MPLPPLITATIIEVMEGFLEKNRPPAHIRHELDLGYRIEGNNVFVFEIRPVFLRPDEIGHMDIAKTTFVKSKGIWKVYWMRGNLKWYPYDPSEVKSIAHFARLVEEDELGCFFG